MGFQRGFNNTAHRDELADRTTEVIDACAAARFPNVIAFVGMKWVKPDVQTICVGSAFSMGALLLAAGTKGKRFILPHGKVMLHQPSGGATGQSSDIQIHAKEIVKTKQELNRILSECTGKPIEQIAKDTDRDMYMSAEEAVAYGVVDEIFKPGVRKNKKEKV